MISINWHSAKKLPICDAVLVSEKGLFLWHGYESAAGPGYWDRVVREVKVKKWARLRDLDF